MPFVGIILVKKLPFFYGNYNFMPYNIGYFNPFY